MPSAAATMMLEMSTVSKPVKTAALAYQLWLDNGCPVGSDQEDWFRAEAMLTNELIAKCEDLSRHPSILRRDTRPELEKLAGLPWEGHWEVWESEWVSTRWIWDFRPLHVGSTSWFEVSSRVG